MCQGAREVEPVLNSAQTQSTFKFAHRPQLGRPVSFRVWGWLRTTESSRRLSLDGRVRDGGQERANYAKFLRELCVHAGNTLHSRISSLFMTVHPRACGEHSTPTYAVASPHRFIPAHAGNTTDATRSHADDRFIPAHAGNTCSRRGREVTTGSSPRMRGTRLQSWSQAP